MQATGQFWRTVALAGLLAGLAGLFAEPLLLLGTGAIVALLVVSQWAFLRQHRRIQDSLTLEVDHPKTLVRQGESVPVTLSVALGRPAPVDVAVSLRTPLGARNQGEALAVTIPAGEETASVTSHLEWRTTGTAWMDAPTVTLESRDGLFSSTIERGETSQVVVEPRTVEGVHVGEGGSRVDAYFGSHRSGETGQGIDPAELRDYIPGDDVRDIDWKSTARQGDPYVMEYERETDRRTVILFDHRASTARGHHGEEAYRYLRAVALSMALSAVEARDPLGLYAIGDDGLTTEIEPAAGPAHYRTIRQRLHEIEPTEAETEGTHSRGPAKTVRASTPETARRKATMLAGEETAFATRVRPFLEEGQQYVRRLEGDPLFDVARTYASTLQGESRTLIFTDDSNPVEVRETVKVARAHGGYVTVFLAPRALFPATEAIDPEETYEAYREFETVRRKLASIDRVDAYEVGPADRLEALLEQLRRSV